MKRILQSAILQTLLAWLAARYFMLVARTTRWRIEGATRLDEFAAGAPCIVVFWHESLPSMPVFWLQAKQRRLRRAAVVLASRHRDGQLIGRIVRNLGLLLVSGSSSRGGAAGLRGLLNALAAGAHVGLTPDGPRGPRRFAAPGAAQLAALSGARVLPCAAFISRAVQLESWDHMRLPLPFSRGVLVCGDFLTVGRQDWVAAQPAIAAALNAAIARAGDAL